MLECERYKMFQGTATVTPKNPKFPTEVISGTWLYKPEYGCWYVNGHSFPAEIVSNFVDLQPTVGGWISVEDRLPEELNENCPEWSDIVRPTDEVLVYLKNQDRQLVAWYSYVYNTWTTINEECDYKHSEITHWMPLPTPPEDA